MNPDVTIGGNFPTRTFDVDFNGDGAYEVRMNVSANSTTGFRAYPSISTRIESVPGGDPGTYYAWPIALNETVQSAPVGGSQWIYNPGSGSGLGVCQTVGSSLVCFGYFWDFTVANIGVEFTLADGVHYGYVELEGIYGLGRIRSYAWETDPGVPIVAGAMPEPSRAVLIFAGMLAVLSHRRRRRALGSG
ncbi:MAG: PEP-CTERM sorting domain-containing protein [Verrucomicrobiaceae bacterium]|nr:PEP-CTERM sorting domain-containing protein [Verrucomicrobiaceae bacterium]